MERRSLASGNYGYADRRTQSQASEDEERNLVLRAAGNDREAFARLYDRFVSRIYKYIYYKVGTRSEAEDLTGQVFLKAWEAIGRYKWTARPFSAWLYRIAHNLIVDHFRARRETTSLEEIHFLEEAHSNLDELAQKQWTARALQQAISRLSPDQRQVILLRFIEGYNTLQVAEIMGRQPGAVRTLQHRGLCGLNRMIRRGQLKL